MRQDQALAMFARPPARGAVKTRLQPAFSAEEALALYEAMLGDGIERLREARKGLADPFLFWAEPFDPPAGLAASLEGIAQRVQRGADLGERMARAFQELLQQGFARAVLVGADAPTLPSPWLAEAFDLLRRHDVVLGPADDGGYYLIGARRLHLQLFRNIPWGTAKVLPLTRKRLREKSISCAELPPWYDVDTPEDLARLWRELRHGMQKGLPGLPRRTWQALTVLAPGRL